MPEVNLEFLAEQQDRILRELSSLRDDMSVVSAITSRLDNTIDRLRSELTLEMQGLRDEMSEIRAELRTICTDARTRRIKCRTASCIEKARRCAAS